MATPRYGEAEDVRRAILSCVGLITPKRSPQIAREVSELVGEPFGERRAYRWVRRLLAEGVIVQTPGGYVRARARRPIEAEIERTA